MKTKSLLMISIVSVALFSTPGLFGQDTDQPARGRRGRFTERLSNLSPQERQQLQAAQDKALNDPAVQAARQKMERARREFRDAMRTAILKADPSVQPILDKVPGGHSRRRSGP
jgi:hypothetical protein